MYESSQVAISPYAPSSEKFETPAVYDGLEVFEADIDESIAKEIKHLAFHAEVLEQIRLERIAAGADPFGAELKHIENTLISCEIARAELETLDKSDALACFQTCIKSVALDNQATDLECKYNFTFSRFFKSTAGEI